MPKVDGHSIRTVEIAKRYGQKRAVKGISIVVKSGEIVGLLGPNGSGKTTSFYMIAGIVKPTSGKVLLDDNDVTKIPISIRSRLGIGYLPQESSVFKSLTVEGNINAALEFSTPNKADRRERLQGLLEEFSITHIRKSVSSALSGGERRRVEVARCLAMNPHFILLDEPFAGVDPVSLAEIEAILQKLKTRNIGILITDHNIRETLRIIDRGYILVDGQVVTEGKKQDIITDSITKQRYLGENFTM